MGVLPSAWPGFLDFRSESNRQRLLVRAALAVYVVLAISLILQKPGLQYDEALLVLGAVHMRHSPNEITLPHDPNTWIPVFGRWIPLMTVRYAGAVKEYLCLPLFALFGTRTALIRLVSMTLGGFGIWGVAKLLREQVGGLAAGAAALILAVNPAYLSMTVFDNGTVSAWMAALGLLAFALSRYLNKPSTRAAMLIGVALGFGIWARANFIWAEAAIGAAALIVLRRRFPSAPSHWLAAVGGGVLGGLPFLIYQIVSRGGTWEAIGMFSEHRSLADVFPSRLVMFAESLVCDREHRVMWNGPEMPAWQRWLFPAIVLACCANWKTIWSRAAAIAFLIYAAILFPSRVIVAEHHFVTMLPFAAVLVTLAAVALIGRYPKAVGAVAALASVYLGVALYWHFSAVGGLRETGGVGVWSDGLIPLANYLQANYRDREVKIVDWGLQNNLYVVTDGRLRTREIFWDATRETVRANKPWMEEIREGGVFLRNAVPQLPDPPAGFDQALTDGRPLAHRYTVPQRDGHPYAEVIEIEPNTIHQELTLISTADPTAAKQLEGFWQIEEGGWRWTKRNFAVTLGGPEATPRKNPHLALRIYIPESSVQKLGPITISSHLNGHALAPETYRQSGTYTLTRDVEPAWLKPDANRAEFALDKALPPTPEDERELGIIVQSIALENR